MNILKVLVGFLCVGNIAIVQAQTIDDLLLFSNQDYQGTARFSAMGGAFNALGGDFGSLSTNPAGVAVFRRSELSFTPTITVTKASSDYFNQSVSKNRTRFGLSNLGYVGVYLTGKDYGVVSYNLAVGYNKTNDFFKYAPINLGETKTSVIDAYADIANSNFDDKDPAYIHDNRDEVVYDAFAKDFGSGIWSTVASVKTNLVKYVPRTPTEQGGYQTIILEGENVRPTGFISQRGSVGEYVLSGGVNISNKIYLGATMGVQDLRYEKIYTYEEVGVKTADFRSLWQEEYVVTQGTGYNFKLGAIVRPVDELRLGFAFHTPTFYNIRTDYSLAMESYIGSSKGKSQTPINLYEYGLQTPYRIEAGIAYVFTKYGIISLDYELVGNSAMRMRDVNNRNFVQDVNNDIKEFYRPSSNLKVGAEVNLGAGFMLRGGFNYLQSAYNKEVVDAPYVADSYVYAAGLGYRKGIYFIDLTGSIFNSTTRHKLYFTQTGQISEKIQKTRIMLSTGIKF